MSIRFLIQEHKKQKMKSESKTEDVAAKLHIASLEEKIEMSDGYKGDYLKAVADVAFLNARIYQLEQERQWISVEERLPDERFEVAVCGINEWLNRKELFCIGTAKLFNGKWVNVGHTTVTHWMPLPPEGE